MSMDDDTTISLGIFLAALAAIGSVSFCHDRSLGMGVQVVEGQNAGRWDQQFSDLDQVRKPGEYPRWFVHYKRAAEETKHGILILQLTNDYFKLRAQFYVASHVVLINMLIPGLFDAWHESNTPNQDEQVTPHEGG